MPKHKEYPFIEGKDVSYEQARSTWEELVAASKITFHDSHLVEPGDIDQTDLDRIREFYRQVKVISPEVFNDSTWVHLQLTGIGARVMGEHYNTIHADQLNLDELEALGLLHDIGRSFTHRIRRNDVLGRRLETHAGFKPAFLSHFFDEGSYMPARTETGAIDNTRTARKYLSIVEHTMQDPYQAIQVTADNIGKYSGDHIRRWQENIDAWQFLPVTDLDRSNTWPSEYLQSSAELGHPIEVHEVYIELQIAVEAMLGVTLDDVVDEMEKRLKQKPLEPLA